MNILSTNLKLLLKNRGVIHKELADFLEVKANTISNYVNGISEPSIDTILKIVNYLDVDIGVFLLFDFEKYPEAMDIRFNKIGYKAGAVEEYYSKALNTLKINEPEVEYKKAYKTISDGIPLLDVEAAAGRGNEVFNLNNYDIEANYFIPDFEKVDFMLKVRGNSMWPKYNGGDLVACRIIKSLTSIQWNRAYVIAAGDNGILIKRLKKSTIEGNYLLVSDNKDYDPIEMPITEVFGLALVVGTIRLE